MFPQVSGLQFAPAVAVQCIRCCVLANGRPSELAQGLAANDQQASDCVHGERDTLRPHCVQLKLLSLGLALRMESIGGVNSCRQERSIPVDELA